MSKVLHYDLTSEDEGLRVRSLIKNRLNISSRLLRSIKYRGGQILLNGNEVRTDKCAYVGDRLTVIFPREKSNFDPQPIAFDVLYEDEDLLVIDKPAGYVVHPTKGHPSGTIANGVMDYMIKKGDSYKIRFANRLDMDTSGVLLIAKNSMVQESFAAQSNVKKKYTALVSGIIKKDEATIDEPIGQVNKEKVSRSVMEEGARSITHFRVMERFKKGYTLLELEIETGRTHQIRVHLSHIGHPVLGDVLYGEKYPNLIERQALHAHYLELTHPFTKKRISFKSNLPSDFQLLIDKVRDY